MTGERWEWFRVAAHLKTPVAELQDRMTYNEFLDWVVYLQKTEVERDLKHEHYLAQIAAEVCRSRVAHPGKVKTSDFLVRFKTPTEIKTESDRAAKIASSKAAWGIAVNLNLN